MSETKHATPPRGLEFEDVVNQFYQPLYHFAFSLARQEAEACDLTQQTFYIWARKGQQLREPAKVKTWLFTTLHREFLRGRRHESRFPKVALDSAAAELPTADPRGAENCDGHTILECLHELDDTFRAPLALFYLEDCSYRDIAQILELPIGTVQSRIARGKAQLQQRLLRP